MTVKKPALLCSTEDFIPLLDLCLTEDFLNRIIIHNQDNINLLHISLKVKYYYILQGLQKKFPFSVENILKKITRDTFEHICKILELCILVQDADDVTSCIISHLQETCKKEQDPFITVNLLYTITNVYYENKLKLPHNFNNWVQRSYNEILQSNSRSLQNQFCKLIVKYVTCTDEVSDILSFALSFDDIYTISCCFHVFVEHLSNIDSERFWGMIINNLKSCDYQKKLALHILKKYIQFVNGRKNFMDESEIIKGDVHSGSEFTRCWNDYFILMEISQEKPLHLITPALALIPNVLALHSSWILCMYSVLLSHSQNAVVFFASDIILQEKFFSCDGNFLQKAIQCLLPALNKYECSDNYYNLFDKLKKMSALFKDAAQILLKESLQIIWSPVPAWYFYSSVTYNACKCDVDFTLIIDIFNHVKKLPNSFIRDNCYHILLKFLVQQRRFGILEINEFLKIAVNLKKCDSKLPPLFYKYANNLVQFYNEKKIILKKIYDIGSSTLITIDEIDIVLQIVNYNTEILTALQVVSCKVTDCKITDCLVSYLCKNNAVAFNIGDYLERKLDDVTSNTLFNVTDYVKLTNLQLLARCKELLILPDLINFRNNIIFAFKLYSNNIDGVIDKDTFDIVKIWNERLLRRDKIESDMCKCYIKIHVAYLDSAYGKTNSSLLETFYSTVVSIFDTQTEEVWLSIYENVDTINKFFKTITYKLNYSMQSILNKLLEELHNFKSTDNFLRAWLPLIRTILQDTAVLEQEDTFPFVEKISEITLMNDKVAYIFVNEIVDAPIENIMLLLDLIASLVLYGSITKRDKRCEFNAYKDIDKIRKRRSRNNPNYILTNIRTIAVNTIFRVQNSGADLVADVFIERYRRHFKKRYFYDSEVHLSKLRIVQILLSLRRHLSVERKRSIIDFIIDSICEESHQPCVKHLMQWLLILFASDLPEYLPEIVKKINTINCNHPSSLVTLIPVLCHIGFKGTEPLIDGLIQSMQLNTMGAHFKLRVYSQVAILKLIETSIERKYIQIQHKYDTLYNSIQTVLQTAGTTIDNILQTDRYLLNRFDIEKYYHLQSLYIDIPRLKNVPETEWVTIDPELFYNSDIPVTGITIDLSNVKSKNTSPEDTIDYSINNIQKKISPTNDFEMINEDETRNELILVATLVDSAANLGGIARTCEIYGVKQLIVCDRKVIGVKEFKSLSMSAEHWVDIIEIKQGDLKEYLENVREENYTVIGIEQTAKSVKLHTYKFPRKCVLVLGNEKEGIPSSIFPFLDVCIEIPQFGLLRSLNVHVAGAITVWEYVKQNILI